MLIVYVYYSVKFTYFSLVSYNRSKLVGHFGAHHAAMAEPKAGPRYPHCSRLCASEFTLRGQLQIQAAHRAGNCATLSSILTDFSSISILVGVGVCCQLR